jgi:hypothetical protein
MMTGYLLPTVLKTGITLIALVVLECVCTMLVISGSLQGVMIIPCIYGRLMVLISQLFQGTVAPSREYDGLK